MSGIRWTPLAGGLLGLIFYAGSLGLELADPGKYEWLLHGDRAVHHLGWHMFRAAPWTLPLGTTTTLLWPVGSSVGLTDSIPVFAFLFKPLHAFLPADFQYVGLWLLLCFILQGYFGALVVSVWSTRWWMQLGGAALLVAAPPLLARLMHAALVAHWLLLAAIWLYWAMPRASARVWPWALLVGVASATHPYLAFMVMAVVVAAHARDLMVDTRLFWRVARQGVVLGATAAVILWQCGYFAVSGSSDLQDQGFGYYSTNLLAPIMPMEHSVFGPGRWPYATAGQYEGYAYLGAGVLLLVAVGCGVAAARWRQIAGIWPHIPLLLVCTILVLLALSPAITVGGAIVARYDAAWWGPLQVFRSSGRMFWPVYYLIVTAALAGVAHLRPRAAVPLLITAVALQFFDVSPAYSRLRDERTAGFRHALESPFWSGVLAYYDTLALVPTNLCSPVDYIDPREFLLLAGRHALNVNAGMVARFDTAKAEAYCRTMGDELRGALRDETLYVGDPRFVAGVREGAGRRAVCTGVDGFAVCTTVDAYARWQDVYDVARTALPPADEFLGFYGVLQAEYQQRLGREPRSVPWTNRQRVEALASYLSYRAFGCDHHEASLHARQRVTGGREVRVCAEFRPGRALPGPGGPYEFLTEFQTVAPGGTSDLTTVDAEGAAVWLGRYAGERLRGSTHVQAQAIVLQQLRDATR